MKSLDSWAGQRQVLYPDPILGQGGYLFIPDQEVGYDDVGGGGRLRVNDPICAAPRPPPGDRCKREIGEATGPIGACDWLPTKAHWERVDSLSFQVSQFASGNVGNGAWRRVDAASRCAAQQPSSPVPKRNGGGEAWFLLGLPGSVFCWVSKRCQVLFFCPCPANGLKAFSMTSPLPAPPVSTTNFFQTPLCDDGEILAPF